MEGAVGAIFAAEENRPSSRLRWSLEQQQASILLFCPFSRFAFDSSVRNVKRIVCVCGSQEEDDSGTEVDRILVLEASGYTSAPSWDFFRPLTGA